MATDFETTMAELTRTYCRESLGEDARGNAIMTAWFLTGVIDLIGKGITAAGGDASYLPTQDAIECDVRCAMQGVIDAEDIANERRAEAEENWHARHWVRA